jgi:superfamily II DNA/RNA helicase
MRHARCNQHLKVVMPPFNKSAPKGAANSTSGDRKAGSKSAGHRGFRAADAPAAPKQRWTTSDRAQRATGERPSRASGSGFRGRDADGGRPASTDRRPDWTPREKPAYQPRGERPAYGDRPNRTERPAYNNERPAYGDRQNRNERPSNDRPSYGDRPARTERPAYGRGGSNNERPARPAYGDRTERPERSGRPSYNDRPARTDRPSTSSGNGYRDPAARTERPSTSSGNGYRDRPARPSYGDRPARPSYNNDRAERPARRDVNSDRASRTSATGHTGAERHDSDFYPNREHKAFSAADDVVLERLEADAIQAKDVEGVTFADLGLGGNIVRELAALGAESPFPIQAATIPDVLSGRDVLGRGKTGSGKTIAFGAPLVERLMENNGGKNRQMGRKPRALILAPTRELALQIDRTVQPIARSVGLFTTQIYGGVPQYRQVSALQRGVDIIVGTPGRIEDLIEQGRLDLSEVTITVLDEADHMCDLGFLEPVQRILNETKEGGQRLLFSATLDKGVATLVNEYLTNPSVHEVAGEDQASSTIDHRVLLIEQRDKRRIIEELSRGEGKTLVFTRTRAFAEELSDLLEDAGIPSTSLHGDLNQSRRTRNLQLLTSGRVKVLVATDVAARGIHVDDITLVIQADAPEEYKTYLHRSGRTGRAGKKGTVVTLIPKARRRRMDELLDRAEITASVDFAAPGDQLLEDLAAL